MNYDSMSIVELKQVAKTRRIKMYYTKKRLELIRLLSMPDLPDTYKIEKLTIVQLRQNATEKGLRGFWKLSRDELVNLLYPGGTLTDNVDQKPKISNHPYEDENQQSDQSSDVGVKHV
jgi:hypothetical protein